MGKKHRLRGRALAQLSWSLGKPKARDKTKEHRPVMCVCRGGGGEKKICTDPVGKNRKRPRKKA